ncbi:putative bifunctional diguanylate cyclase/phosphodiesterase [Sphingobium boeckii]|uniref:Diguanylate cyclase (GGDEF)-like protein n=1 Tax=Sphingobium boeckii TaxID=1082345 RepID=A0A7W9EE71_9SPHN|nr:EAL domain-containing protein [Sphingobium boeckii]MBB5684695.1 diguanylate cyclase (GGDEF)-like protein [Sphingobium boeckii]
MSARSAFFALLFLLLTHVAPGTAKAEMVQLRTQFCHASAPADFTLAIAGVESLRYDCDDERASGYQDRWLWLKLNDAGTLQSLPAQWQLLIDQTRFDQIAVMTVDRHGRARIVQRGARALADNWAPGGLLRFGIDRPGAEIENLYIGFLRLDELGLMRKVTAASPESAARSGAAWLALMGLFTGALLSAFAYNLLIYTGHRYPFQRWYLIWVVAALAYGLSWTNMIAFVAPNFVGPMAVRLDLILISILIGTGNFFFLGVLEVGLLPRWLSRSSRALAVLVIVLGIAASMDRVFPAALMDRWLNYVMLVGVISVGVGVVYAIKGRSRVVWFYLVGWAPVLAVFALRLSRNLGLLPQNDAIDMATFGALAFESIALSLAIADRFRHLRQERDHAEQARTSIAIESETLRRAAHTDFLTGLGNRASFQNALRAAIDDGAPGSFMLFLIDVDHLKSINDRLGHDGGDALLIHIADLLRRVAGPDDQVARIGGDEFALIVSDPDGVRAQQIGDALDAMQGEMWRRGGRAWSLSLSIGSTGYAPDTRDAELLYKNADLAMYHAKKLGRKRRFHYDPSLRAGLDRRLSFARDAWVAIERKEFVLHYQPIVSLQTGSATGYEALLRWQHPEHGLLAPAVFGDMLTDIEVGTAVQEHVLDLIIAKLCAYPEIPAISMNFTAAQLDGVHAAQRLLQRLNDSGIAPHRLCIEVTEDIVLGRTVNGMVKALRLLHEAGVGIALDDFGTGYASLIHLKQLPIDTLKIDRSFVLSLFDEDGQSEEIVRAIIGLGHGLRKSVVAEGVETPAQRARLIALGCNLGQGYLFARPAPLLPFEHSGHPVAGVA